MKIQVNTDGIVDGSQDVILSVNNAVSKTLDRFKDQITRIEVYLSAERANGMSEHQCAIEARVEHQAPVTVVHKALNPDLAVKGAIEKMKSALTRLFDRIKPY